MSFCINCGKEIDNNAVICIHCGCSVKPAQQSNASNAPVPQTEIKATKFCRYCGSAINENAVVCIHCGCSIEESQTAAKSDKKINVLSILGFIFAFVVPLAGLIISCISLRQFKKNPNQSVKGLATAGLIISIVFLSLEILDFIVTMLEAAAGWGVPL